MKFKYVELSTGAALHSGSISKLLRFVRKNKNLRYEDLFLIRCDKKILDVCAKNGDSSQVLGFIVDD